MLKGVFVIIVVVVVVVGVKEKGVALGSSTISIPNGTQEISIGIIMIVILMFRPSGLTRNTELAWKGWPFSRVSENKRSP